MELSARAGIAIHTARKALRGEPVIQRAAERIIAAFAEAPLPPSIAHELMEERKVG